MQIHQRIHGQINCIRCSYRKYKHRTEKHGEQIVVTVSCLYCISVASCSGAVMRQTLSVDWIARRRQATTSHCCRVQRRVEIWVHRNIIVLATTAWVESLCQWGRVVVVVHCSAVECDHWRSQPPTRDLHCPLISDQAAWRQWMFSVDNQWRLLHSPTHTRSPTHTDVHSHLRERRHMPRKHYCELLLTSVCNWNSVTASTTNIQYFVKHMQWRHNSELTCTYDATIYQPRTASNHASFDGKRSLCILQLNV